MNSMLKITFSLIGLLSLIIITFTAVYYTTTDSTNEPTCFTAAILDHHPFYDNNVTENIEKNFQIYHNATIIAKEHDVDIIVFPESALMTEIRDRESAKDYSINIKKANLCKVIDNINDKSISIFERLSCLAKKFEIFVVAQLLEKQSCNENETTTCRDGYYVFNTAIMFDRMGRLIAKYHKMQPYGEMLLDPAPKDEIIFIETSLGKLGLQICFDIIYNKPGHYMAKYENVETIIFPTHWMDEAPFLSASQFQMAWSLSNDVNLIAANIHLPIMGSLGSGIYNGPDKTFFNAHFVDDDGERLVISRLPIHPRSTTRAQCSKNKNRIIKIPVENRKIQKENYKLKQMLNENVIIKSLEKENNKISLEHQGVKCELEFKANSTIFNNQNEKYFLIGSNRSRDNPSYQWGEEFCALIFCTNFINETCKNYSSNSLSSFSYVNLTATFDVKTVVYPSALEYQNRLIPMNDIWTFSNKTIDDKNIHEIIFGDDEATDSEYLKLSTLSLYGRAYERDPPYKQVPAD